MDDRMEGCVPWNVKIRGAWGLVIWISICRATQDRLQNEIEIRWRRPATTNDVVQIQISQFVYEDPGPSLHGR